MCSGAREKNVNNNIWRSPSIYSIIIVMLYWFQCDHRGHPRYFNPFEQISLGQATMLMGIFVIVLWNNDQFDHYWAPLWSGILVSVYVIFLVDFFKNHVSLLVLIICNVFNMRKHLFGVNEFLFLNWVNVNIC